MYPELFRIPGLDVPIFGYGLMLVIGLFAAIELARRLARHQGMDPDVFSNIGLIAMVAGVVGARALYVIENWRDFFLTDATVWSKFLNVFNISSGGLVYYGGVMGGTAAVLGYLLWRKLPVLKSADIIAPCLMVGLAFGRIGCYLNGCCWGKECELPVVSRLGEFPYGSPPYMSQLERGLVTPSEELLVPTPEGQLSAMTRDEAVRLPALREILKKNRSLPVHPTQLYSSLTAGLLAGGLVWLLMRWKPAAGLTFATMLILEGITRTLIEAVRINPPLLGPLSISMVLGLASAAAGGVLMFYVMMKNSPPPETRRIGRLD